MQEFDRVAGKTLHLRAGVMLQGFGRRDMRHCHLMADTLFQAVERGAAKEDRAPFLNGGNAAGSKTAAVAHGIDLINYRAMRIAGAQEVTMQRVGVTFDFHRTRGSGQRLAEYLATE